MLILFIVGCSKSQNRSPLTSSTIVEHTVEKVEKKNSTKVTAINTKIIVPPNTQQMATFQRTTLIGSIDHPTIDGGIINAADGLPVNLIGEK